MNNLKKVETSTKNDDSSSKKDEESNYSIYKQRQQKTSTAKTGDEANVILFVWMAFISWLGIKKRRFIVNKYHYK